jgi:hypothetical protein
MKFDVFRRFNFIFLIGGITTSLVVFIFGTMQGLLPVNFWIYRCDPSLYGGDKFLAYCSDSGFGGYEHGAIYYGLEPGIVGNLRAADVLFLGSSRTQVGFSSDIVDQFFETRGVKYFNMGFNFGEADVFAQKIITRHDLKPAVVVVNADYFFTNSASSVAKELIGNTGQVELEYFLKGWVQNSHQEICSQNKLGIGAYICGRKPALYRSRSNGRVYFANWPREMKINSPEVKNPGRKIMRRLINNAADFKKFLDKRNICLVITVVPSVAVSPILGRKIAAALGVPFILPEVKNLTYLDGNHLDEAGATAWSTKFLNEFERLKFSCLPR